MSSSYHLGASRFQTTAAGMITWHSFAFGKHYDPTNVGFGNLLAFNDENLLTAEVGYPNHPHQGVEIITYLVSGQLEHRSSAGASQLTPGQVQHFSAAELESHSEIALAPNTRFIQTWLPATGNRSGYRVSSPKYQPVLTPLFGGESELPGNYGAKLFFLSLAGNFSLPSAAWLQVFVLDGRITHLDKQLNSTDCLRITNPTVAELAVTGQGSCLIWTAE